MAISTEIKDFSMDELLERITDSRENYVRMKFNHQISPLENPKELTALRKRIARLNTELRTRQIEAAKAS